MTRVPAGKRGSQKMTDEPEVVANLRLMKNSSSWRRRPSAAKQTEFLLAEFVALQRVLLVFNANKPAAAAAG